MGDTVDVSGERERSWLAGDGAGIMFHQLGARKGYVLYVRYCM